MTTTELLVSRNGQVYVSGTSAFTPNQKAAFIVVNEDAIFTTLTDISGNNMVTESGISSKTITKGMIISPRNGNYIANVVVASGSVIVVFG